MANAFQDRRLNREREADCGRDSDPRAQATMEDVWKMYGKGRWRKLKGMATVELSDGTICTAEIHWYEAHGIGKKEHKIKRMVE